MADDPQTDHMVNLLVGVQSRLYAYILTILGDPEAAADVLQEANLVLWRKAHEFREGDFTAWAIRVAHFQVLAHRKRRRADRLRFGDELVALLAEEIPPRIARVTPQQVALEHCLRQLSRYHRKLIDLRYHAGATVQSVARHVGVEPNAAAQALHRARVTLVRCMSRTLGSEDAS